MPTEIQPIRFGTRKIGHPAPVCIVAEIGVNHEGNLERCRELVAAAAEAGADAIKLQTMNPDTEYAPTTESYEIFTRARLTREEIAKVFEFAKARGIEVFSTCGDTDMLAFIDSLAPAAHKVSSGLADHLALIRAAAETGRPLLISTGMSSLSDIDRAVSVARTAGAKEIALLQCTSLYPAEPRQANLRVIRTLETRYRAPIGFSDHTMGTRVAELAVAAGACIVEKHLTFDRTRSGFDHNISVDPNGLAQLVRNIREVESVTGDGSKYVLDQEQDAARRLRRCVVAAHDLEKGHVLTDVDVNVMRVRDKPAGHVPAHALDSVYGRTLARPIRRLEPLRQTDLGALRNSVEAR